MEQLTKILTAMIPVALGVAAGMWVNELRQKAMNK